MDVCLIDRCFFNISYVYQRREECVVLGCQSLSNRRFLGGGGCQFACQLGCQPVNSRGQAVSTKGKDMREGLAHSRFRIILLSPVLSQDVFLVIIIHSLE